MIFFSFLLITTSAITQLSYIKSPSTLTLFMDTRLPPDLCLLGCIFIIVDSQDKGEKVSDIEEENIKSISKQKVSKSFQMPSRRYPCIRGEEEAAPPILMCLQQHHA